MVGLLILCPRWWLPGFITSSSSSSWFLPLSLLLKQDVDILLARYHSCDSDLACFLFLFCYHSPPSGVTKHTQIATKESTKPDKFCVILSHTPIRSSPPEQQEANNKIRHIAIWIPHRHGCFPPTNKTSVSRARPLPSNIYNLEPRE